MRYKICLILVFLFSIIGISAFPLSESEISFKNLENKVNNISSFYENGVKLQYKSDKSIVEELDNLKEISLENYEEDGIELFHNEIRINANNIKISIEVWKDRNNIIVEIEIINRDPSLNIENLMKLLNKFEKSECKEVRYFKYLKGNINNIEEGLNFLKDTSEAKNVNTLEVHNGYIATANLKSGERVNIALSSYNSGTYLIIGTPIIFATY